jgi:ferredoxin-NADP reductase
VARRRALHRGPAESGEDKPTVSFYCHNDGDGALEKTWHGETARINQEMLSKYLNDLREPIYYIAGPPAMVSGMRKMLVASGVDEDDIRTEEFAGY